MGDFPGRPGPPRSATAVERAVVRLHAPAKVNLFLRILAREESGFHQVETLFAALELGDSLSALRTPAGIVLETDGPPMGPPETNLVYRAAQAFLDRSGVDAGVELRLKKRIPVQAGLGGGSSDAAAALKGLANLFPGRLADEEILEIARELGSDVPFFLSPSPLALAWGRGQRVLPLSPLPPAPVLLGFPPLGVPTGTAYQLLARARETAPPRIPATLHSLAALGSWEGIAALAHNDFEDVVLPAYPLLERLRKTLEETGPRITLLSGSGSTLFAVYHRDEEAHWAKDGMQAQFPEARFVLTRTLGPSGEPGLEPGVES